MSDAFDDDAIAAIDRGINAGASNGANPPVTTGQGRGTLPAAAANPVASVAPPGYRQVHPLDSVLGERAGRWHVLRGRVHQLQRPNRRVEPRPRQEQTHHRFDDAFSH